MKDMSVEHSSGLPRNLRMALREATRPEHDRVDALVGELDLSRRTDFAHFCRMHLVAFTALGRRSPHFGISRAIEALSLDLERLGEEAPDVEVFLPSLDPLAVSYIFEGSRLGTQLLRMGWAESADPIVASSDAYFTLGRDPSAWRSLCEMLSQIDSGGERGSQIIADTRRIFSQFARAFLLTAPAPCPASAQG